MEVTDAFHSGFTAWAGFRSEDLQDIVAGFCWDLGAEPSHSPSTAPWRFQEPLLFHEWSLWLGGQQSVMNWRFTARRKARAVRAKTTTKQLGPEILGKTMENAESICQLLFSLHVNHNLRGTLYMSFQTSLMFYTFLSFMGQIMLKRSQSDSCSAGIQLAFCVWPQGLKLTSDSEMECFDQLSPRSQQRWA